MYERSLHSNPGPFVGVKSFTLVGRVMIIFAMRNLSAHIFVLKASRRAVRQLF